MFEFFLLIDLVLYPVGRPKYNWADVMTYAWATLDDQMPMPKWMEFDATKLALVYYPSNDEPELTRHQRVLGRHIDPPGATANLTFPRS